MSNTLGIAPKEGPGTHFGRQWGASWSPRDLKRKQTGSTAPEQNTIASDSAAWDLGDPNSDEGIFNNKNNPAEKTTTSGAQDLDTKNELDALKEEMQQALKG